MNSKTGLFWIGGTFALCYALCLVSFKPAQSFKGKNPVTFYKVPLVCSAAPEIGCGSKAKPVLKQLEQDNTVAEAWINHAGTVVAVVWKGDAQGTDYEKNALAIFKEQNMDVQLVSGSEYDELWKDFNKKTDWLRHKDVDRLSMIEAGEIAARLVTRVNTTTPLNDEKTFLLKTSIKDYFKNLFVTLQTDNINKQPDLLGKFREQTANDLLAIGKKYLDVSQMNAFQEAISLGLQPVEGEPGYESEGCCSKPKNLSEKAALIKMPQKDVAQRSHQTKVIIK